MYGQKFYPSSNIFPLTGEATRTRDYAIEKSDKSYLFVPPERKEARYFIAVSSDRPVKDAAGNSYLVDVSETFIKILDVHVRNLDETIKEQESRIGNLEVILRNRETQISSIDAVIKEKDTRISNLERQREEEYGNWRASENNLKAIVEERQAQIGNLEAGIREKDNHIGNLEAGVREKDNHISNLGDLIRQKEAALNHIYNSHGWKALLIYYRVRDKVFPANSHRKTLLLKKSSKA